MFISLTNSMAWRPQGRGRGFTLIEIVLVLAIGFGLMVSGVLTYRTVQASQVFKDRTTMVNLLLIDVPAADRDLQLSGTGFANLIKSGTFGMIEPLLADSGSAVSLHWNNPGGGIEPSKEIYVNFHDETQNFCRKLQTGLVNNGKNLYGGTSPYISGFVVVRCTLMDSGEYLTELRTPYVGIDAFKALKGF
ncbi:type II secretion system protein [Paracoccus litorisediminis]|uniref:type II secretion system protein n=1 Tax=Paracoccus litorisediminis TaxID=2006130 RepID=UPI00373035AC